MSGSQKFIARNRAPRVQIEYDVELYGAEKKVQLPFVMGVLSDLSGKAEKPSVDQRGFLEIDVDNFDDRMRAVAPRAMFTVPNTLTGEGNLSVDLTFEKMSDFSPEAIAVRVGTLAPLLEARRQLSDLMAYMDGKSGAETLIETILGKPDLLKALAGDSMWDSGVEDALASLRAALPDEAGASEDRAEEHGRVLGGIERAVSETKTDDGAAKILGELARQEVQDERLKVAAEDVLAAIELRDVPYASGTGDVQDVLAGITNAGEAAPEDADDVGSILAGIQHAEDTPQLQARAEEILSGIDRVEEQEHDPAEDDVLANIERVEDAEAASGNDTVLSGLARSAPDVVPGGDDLQAILSGIEPTETAVEDDAHTSTALGGIRAPDSQPQQVDEAIDDILGGLEIAEARPPADDPGEILAGVAATGEVQEDDRGAVPDILAGLESAEPVGAQKDETQDILAGLDSLFPDEASDANDPDVSPDQIDPDVVPGRLNVPEVPGTEGLAAEPTSQEVGAGSSEPDALAQGQPDTDSDDLDALLSGMDGFSVDETDLVPDGGSPAEVDETGEPDAGPDAGEQDLDALLASFGDDRSASGHMPGKPVDPDSGQFDPIGDLAADVSQDNGEGGQDIGAGADDLDQLLATIDTGADGPPEPEPPEEQVAQDDLDALLADLGGDAAATLSGEDQRPADTQPPTRPQSPFGHLSLPRPGRGSMHRPTFRMALFGDFTGRASAGKVEIGDALAARRPIALDIDSVDDVIAGFATTLRLPIGRDGAAIEVKLGGLDDLHPDELFENVEIFEALSGIRRQLGAGSTAERARDRLKAWSEAYGTPVSIPRTSAATSVPANVRLSDFQKLIGDTRQQSAQVSPIDTLLAQIVGPHIVHAPDQETVGMTAAIDGALASAMRLVLHHPDFQAVESQWRSLDLLARNVETDENLQIVLYDISAAELAADLAAQEDLSGSGLFRLMTGELDPETGHGGYSALFGLYTFEETPPHAELMARIGAIAAHVDAPFFTSIGPAFLETEKEDRHPLVAQAWDSVRALPDAGYIGLASPRFMLRLPYGAKTDPIYPFDFEEFSQNEGLRGLLWANPVVLVLILLARTRQRDRRNMDLGSTMSLGDLPFHYITDRHGDQVALPCTERNLTSEAVQKSLARGYMPVVWMKGRNEIRLGSFQSLAGREICGPWSDDVPPPRKLPGEGGATMELEVPVPTQPDAVAESIDTQLDDLLATFDDEGQQALSSSDEIDPDLAALLEGL